MAGPQPIGDHDELLHRQVHPAFVQDGRVGSQAFKPTPKDQGQLSVSRGSLTSAEDAYILYTDERGLESVGVWSLAVGECVTLDLFAYPDPLPADGAHAFIDCRNQTGGAVVRLSKRLAALARARGRQYPRE